MKRKRWPRVFVLCLFTSLKTVWSTTCHGYKLKGESGEDKGVSYCYHNSWDTAAPSEKPLHKHPLVSMFLRTERGACTQAFPYYVRACPYTGMLVSRSSHGRISGNPRPGKAKQTGFIRVPPSIVLIRPAFFRGWWNFLLLLCNFRSTCHTDGAKYNLLIRQMGKSRRNLRKDTGELIQISVM